MPLKIGLIGCGHIHVPGFINMMNKRTDAKFTHVWDHDPARAKKRADELHATLLEDYKSMLSDSSIDGIVVCSETNRHEPIVMAVTEAKKHLFVEKPLGFTPADAKRMADAIDKAGVKFQTGYFMRSNPINRFVKEHVAKGSFGKITHVRMSNVHQGALAGWFDTEWRWMADPKQSGCGGFGDLGTHVLDIMLWIFGDVGRVTASITNGVERYAGCDESGEGMLVFKSGIIGTIAAGWDDVANPVTLQINGTEGNATVFNNELFFQSTHVPGADGKTAWKQLPEAMPHAFELFIDALGGKSVPLVTAKEAAYRNVVMGAMYDGASGKKWVELG